MGSRFGSCLVFGFALVALFVSCQGQVAPVTESTVDPMNTTMLSTTTMDPDALCRSKTTCDDCVNVQGAKCYFCHANATGLPSCRLYPAEKIFPRSEECPLSQARWGVCWVNFEALIISMSVIAGVVLISVITAIYCCCCRSRKSGMVDSTSIKWERETREREQRHADRRVEREAKMDQIRQKYGLNRETSSYDRMA